MAEAESNDSGSALVGSALIEALVSEQHPTADRGLSATSGAAVTWAAIAVHRFGATEPIPDDFLRRVFIRCLAYNNR